MNSLLNYLLEVNISLVLFMLVYVLLLRGETQFSFNRIYLMLSLIASFVFPFFHFRVPVSNELVPSANNLMPSYLLNELRVNGDEINVAQAANEITPLVVVEWVYAIILVTNFLATTSPIDGVTTSFQKQMIPNLPSHSFTLS
jgi:hypothetical protein